MPMTPRQIIAFNAEEISHIDSAIEAARSTSNYSLAAMNYNEKIKNHLCSALISWRHDIVDPRTELNAALKTAQAAVEELTVLDPSQLHWRSLDLSAVLIVAFLLKANTDFLRKKACDLSTWQSYANQHSDAILETVLCERLTSGKEVVEWKAIEAHFKKRAKTALFLSTHMNYLETLDQIDAKRFEVAEKSVQKGFDLYTSRASDSYYASGPALAGGGPNNQNMIDFALAAVVEYGKRRRQDFCHGLHSEHFWRWGQL